MKSIEIKGTKRENTGKKDTISLRKNEQVPCNLYGGKENIQFYAHENVFRGLIFTPNVYLVKLDINGKQYDAILQDIQFHPVTDKVLHIDFLQIFEDRQLSIEVPVHLKGDSAGVKEGGKMHLQRRRLVVKAFAKDLPDALELDVSDLALGKSVKVGDLSYNNIELLDHPNDVVCSVKLTRMAKSDMGVEEEVEGEAVEGEATDEQETSEATEAPAAENK